MKPTNKDFFSAKMSKHPLSLSRVVFLSAEVALAPDLGMMETQPGFA